MSAPAFDVERWVRNFEAGIRMALESASTASALGALGLEAGGHGGRKMDVLVSYTP